MFADQCISVTKLKKNASQHIKSLKTDLIQKTF